MTDEIRHLEMSELLAVRDGEGGDASRSHVESCDRCREELDRLRRVRDQLRRLPGLRPQTDLWPAIVGRLRWRQRRRWVGMGAGWLVAAALGSILMLRGSGEGVGPAVVAEPSQEGRLSAQLAPMIDRSSELESLLATYVPERQVLGARQALAVSVLEERLLLIDEALVQTRAGGVDGRLVRDLWQQRVEALEVLVGVQLGQQAEGWQQDDGWR